LPSVSVHGVFVCGVHCPLVGPRPRRPRRPSSPPPRARSTAGSRRPGT